MDALLDGLRASEELARRRELRPLDYVQWLPLQYEFLSDPSLLLQMRCGNKTMGKTWAGYANGIYHSTGRHPFYDVPPPPSRGAIVFPTQGSYIKEGEELWKILPKDEIDPSVTWTDGTGFGGRFPHVKWLNGSITWMVWTGSGGALNLAGPGYDWVHFNEPPRNQRVFSEIKNRTIRGNPGRMWLTFTPVNAPVVYIEKMCKKGVIRDHWRPLSVEAMIPVGSDRPIVLPSGVVCDALWEQSLRDSTLPHEVPVVVDGEWEFRAEGNIFRVFKKDGPRSHVTEDLPRGDIGLRVGIDYGSGKDFSQTALLLAIKKPRRLGHYPRIWIIDEYVSEDETDENHDAIEIIAMLQRWDQVWSDVDVAAGDRPWEGKKGLQRKDNRRMMRALERQLGIRPGTIDPKIDTAKTGKGRGGSKGVSMGNDFLHRSMIRPGHFNVHPRCVRFIAAMGRWAGADDEWKHIIDPARYALDDYVFADYDDGQGPPVVRSY
jgi:hypothetical protein